MGPNPGWSGGGGLCGGGGGEGGGGGGGNMWGGGTVGEKNPTAPFEKIGFRIVPAWGGNLCPPPGSTTGENQENGGPGGDFYKKGKREGRGSKWFGLSLVFAGGRIFPGAPRGGGGRLDQRFLGGPFLRLGRFR